MTAIKVAEPIRMGMTNEMKKLATAAAILDMISG